MYYVVTGKPALNVRRAANRNQRKLNKRLARTGATLHVTSESGRLYAYTPDAVAHSGTVKRDAERYARKVGGTVVKV